MSNETSFTVTRTIQASPTAIYTAFTNNTALQQWLCNTAQVNAVPGGPLLLAWRAERYMVGEYVEVQPDEKIIFQVRGRGETEPSQVEVVIQPNGKGTDVTLLHTGTGGVGSWEPSAGHSKMGWEEGLENLQSVLETGWDLRFTRQPLMGVYVAGFLDEKQARDLGVPVDKGLRIAGALAGLPAEQAGLQKDDVVYTMNGIVLDGPGAYTPYARTLKVGDTIEIEFYRGPEKHTTVLTLTPRPLPEIPLSPSALAELVRAEHDKLDAELDALLDGVTEAEAEHHPGEGEWNVKENLAHLIFSERFTHMQVHGLMGGDGYVAWPNNGYAHLLSAMGASSTLAELVRDLKGAEAATAAIVAGMPEAFVKDQTGSYNQVGQNVLGSPIHTRQHFAQMQAALDSARSSAQ